jgi:hypothetical protein
MSEIPADIEQYALECVEGFPLSGDIRRRIIKIIAVARMVERDRCTRIAEQVAIDTAVEDGEPWVCHVIAKRIRGES